MPSSTEYINHYLAIHVLRLADTLHAVEGLHPQRVLEIGCFPPQALLYPLRLAHYDVYGICSTFEPVPDSQVTTLNLESDIWPYPANYFDVVLLCEVIEHLLIFPPAEVLHKVHSVLAPGGYILITTPNRHHLKNLARSLLPKLPTPAGTDHTYSSHHHEYTLPELTRLVQTNGFTITGASIKDYYTPFRERSKLDPWWLRSLKIAAFGLTSALPPIRDTLVVVGLKPGV